MPLISCSDFDMFYRVDDFTDPWTAPETILLLHGNCESSAAWYAWVPLLARRFRVVRPDRRGFGASTPMPRDFPWTLDVLIEDHVRLMDALGIERVHVVGCKWGGTLARVLAARRPERVRTLTVIGTPPASRPGGEAIPKLVAEFEAHGLKDWARRTMGMRLGSGFPREGVEYWIEFMSRTAVSTMIAFNQTLNYVDIGFRNAAHPVSNARHHDSGERPRFGRGEQGLAAGNSEFEAARAARGFLSCGTHAP